MTPTIEVCPFCDGVHVHPRNGKPDRCREAENPEDRYKCRDCGETFNELEERERGHEHTSLSGGAALLDAADPDTALRGGDA